MQLGIAPGYDADPLGYAISAWQRLCEIRVNPYYSFIEYSAPNSFIPKQ
jgi:hypothetical protein